MNDSIKVFVVKCGSCSAKQVWDASQKHKVCNDCNSTVVLKTASPEDLKSVKAQTGHSSLTFSNYFVYSLSPEDVEEAVAIRKNRQKQMKEDIEERKKYAQLERMNFNVVKGRKLMNDGNRKLHAKGRK